MKTGSLTRRSAILASGMLAYASAVRAGARKYVVGSTATGAPLSFLDLKTNTLTGAMVDIAKAVASDAGFDIEMRLSAFSALIPSLLSRKIDIISAGMLRTPAREKVVDFSEPVYSYGASIVVPARDQRDYRRLEDLKGTVAGAQVGTRFVDQLRAAGAKEVKTYDSLMDMLRDLSAGRIGVAYGDAPILAYEIAQAKITAARFVKSFQPPVLENCCLVVRKGEPDLLRLLNAAVARIRATKIKAILDRWGLG